jgi:hypothetical protein
MHMRQTNLPTSVLAKPQRWLPDMDLNHDKQIQSLLCYRYTIGQIDASPRLGNSAAQSSRQAAGIDAMSVFNTNIPASRITHLASRN